ncbi:MAG: FtsB family cell division protein [Thermodesulfobacteriota bacterium]
MDLPRFIRFFALAFVAVFCVLYAFEFRKLSVLKRENSVLEKRIEELTVRRDRLNALSDSVEKNGSDDRHTERLIREKLGLIKGGEKIFIFRR